MVDDHGGAPGGCRAGESNGWNNAGTGHSALMELNYTRKTPMAASVLKKQSPLTKHLDFPPVLGAPGRARRAAYSASFINTVPHMSFVWGEDNVNFCAPVTPRCNKARYFAVCVTLRSRADQRVGTVSDGRARSAKKVAATRTEIGTDVNYGEITAS